METPDNVITAELISIGDEILFGQITNTNVQWLGTQLASVGIRVMYHSTVGDHAPHITAALDLALSRVQIVLITGGLGPTKDDITKNVLAQYFGSKLVLHEGALTHLKAMLERRGRVLNDLNRGQAMQPDKAEYVHNAIGTAPGMLFRTDKGQVVVSMPGVPAEMKRMVQDTVLPSLVAQYQPPAISHRIIKTIGIAEAMLAEKIAAWEDALPSGISLAYLPSFGQVRLRLTATGMSAEQETSLLEAQLASLVPQIAEYVYATEEVELEQVVGQLLLAANATVATAESCTGGNVAAMLTSIAGSSAYFMGSVVAYANEAKMAMLDVPEDLLKEHGAVSAPVAEAMAMGVRTRLGTTYAVSTTGIAGPGGGTPEKPVGLVYMALAGPDGVQSFRFQLLTERDLNIRMASLWALNLLRKKLTGYL